MANLQDVNYSMNGEQKNLQEKPVDKLSGAIKYEFDDKGKIKNVPKKEWYVFKLVDNTKKGGVYIPNIDDVWNPATQQVERIRLLAGVPSIWVKDQKDLTPEYIKQNGISLQFHRGQKMMRIAAHNTTALEFCRLTNSNIGNPKRVKNSRFEFFEYDFAAAETEAFEKETFELEMAILAKEEKPELMKKHAAFLGIRLVSDLGEPKSNDGIRREYVMYAKRNPKYFKQTRNTPQIEIAWLVKKAISETLIDIGREPGKIFWSNGGGMICVCPQSMQAEQCLIELAMTNNDEGRLFKEQLQKAIT